jgi:hypothetical protein
MPLKDQKATANQKLAYVRYPCYNVHVKSITNSGYLPHFTFNIVTLTIHSALPQPEPKGSSHAKLYLS